MFKKKLLFKQVDTCLNEESLDECKIHSTTEAYSMFGGDVIQISQIWNESFESGGMNSAMIAKMLQQMAKEKGEE